MTDHARAIEAGARAIDPMAFNPLAGHEEGRCPDCDDARNSAREKAEAVIEAAIASGALVPASADNTTLATSATNRIAKVVGMSPEIRDDVHGIIQEALAGLAPASGDYVVVTAQPSGEQLAAGRDVIQSYLPRGEVSKPVNDQWQIAREVWAAMLHAASRTGGGK